jgi:lysophospholipase L1-like esterase
VRLTVSTIALASLALAGAHSRAVSAVASPAGQDVPDLKCPASPTRTVPPPAPNDDPEEPPSPEDLGELATLVDRQPPSLPSDLVGGFSIRGDGELTRRVAFWGDSHLAGGTMIKELSRILSAQGITTASSFMPPTMGRATPSLPIRTYCIGRGWTFEPAYLSSETRFGAGLINLKSPSQISQAYLWLDFRTPSREAVLQKVRLAYQPPAKPTVLLVSVNGTADRKIAIPARQVGSAPESRTLDITADGLVSTLKLKFSQGGMVLQGFHLEHAAPAQLTLDVFGLPSSTVRGFANADPAYLKASLAGADYDAIVLQYGTNEGNAASFDRARYAATLEKALENVRQVFPSASCLLVGPTDRGVLTRRSRRKTAPPDLMKFANIHDEISQVQAEVGARYQCAFWDWQEFMGGAGGSYGWANVAPPLMSRDLTHLTSAGYRRTAAALAASLGWSPQ